VILSTWDDEPEESIPRGSWDVLLNRKPPASGYSHRNFQRLGTAAGLRRAAGMGATHVLKWRTDMLPTRLDVAQLMAWSNERVPIGLPSRLVTCAFRNLTVRQDWFSTIPDLFAFAHIDLMQLLWGDDGIDYMRSMNVPTEMEQAIGLDWAARSDVAGLYCAEAELYANFKSRLQVQLGLTLSHSRIAKDYMRLIDHRSMGICWFGGPGEFRSITQALQHPWWTEKTWKYGQPTVTEWGYPDTGWLQKFRRKHLTKRAINKEIEAQSIWYKEWSD